MKKSVVIPVLIIFTAAIIGAYILNDAFVLPIQSSETTNEPFGSLQGSIEPITHDYATGLLSPAAGQPVKEFALTAKTSVMDLENGLSLPVWTFNGTVPGPEIRVKQGDFVRVNLTNEMDSPVTIHWHGYPVISAMDGIPGYQQDAVRRGESFIYEFNADIPGTYWYHSHQDSSYQVDRGLYGVLVVEPIEGIAADKDFTLVLDEWMEYPDSGMGNMHGSGGMGMGMMGNMDVMEDAMMASLYNIYTVNGLSGSGVEPLQVDQGDLVRIRLVNAGFRTHSIHIPSQDFRVVAVDGQDIENPTVIKDQLIDVAPGERYDVEFTMTGTEGFFIDAHDQNPFNVQLMVPVNVSGGRETFIKEKNAASYPVFEYTTYGMTEAREFAIEQKYDEQFTLELNSRNGRNGLEYTINGKPYGEQEPLKIKTGDNVKITFENIGLVNHPMHIHGHFFTLLEKNGILSSGAEIRKDTFLVKPGEKYVVAFTADNPGDWMIHCHELHHAAAGMMIGVEYTDFKSNFTPNPENTFNIPE